MKETLPAHPEPALQLYAWRAEQRFLFIATLGGAHDLVKEQPISEHSLDTIRTSYEKLAELARNQRGWASVPLTLNLGAQIQNSVKELGTLVSRLILHPDFRHVLEEHAFSEVVVSTNEFSIPWEIAAVGNSFLALEYPVTRRIQTAKRLGRPKTLFRDKLRVLLVYNPTCDLPGTENEAQAILRLLGDRSEAFEIESLTREQCTVRRVLAMLDEADIFHFAGHAYFDKSRPKESGLVLNDGPLLACELENFLEGRCPLLVFLNACESGAFGSADKVLSGDSMASLAHPFIAIGCGAVLASSLPVGDTQAAVFAASVYRLLTQGKSLSEATWQARRLLKEQFGLGDSSWSSFLLFGDGGIRVVVQPEQPLHRADIDRAIDEALQWILEERLDSGNWCDRVYRSEGVNNTAEVVTAFAFAQKALPDAERTASLQRLLSIPEEGFTAFPYEPAGLGTFTSCVAHVLQALIVLHNSSRSSGEANAIANAIQASLEKLLSLEHSRGGWSWGPPQSETGGYTLFTIEAMEALESYVEYSPSSRDRIAAPIQRGVDFLVALQCPEGGWPYRNSASPDAANTCYALTKLAVSGVQLDDSILIRAAEFLCRSLPLDDLSEKAFFVDHRIVIPGTAPNQWPHFEDYGGLGGLCELLSALPSFERHLGTSGLLNRVVRKMIAEHEPGRGWPHNYSTIYITSYYVGVLSRLLNSSHIQ